MNNPIIAKLIENNHMSILQSEIDTSFELSEKIYKALEVNGIKTVYHFNLDGKIIFDKMLGRDADDNFYNEQNGNIEARKEEAKRVIVTVLLDLYNSLA